MKIMKIHEARLRRHIHIGGFRSTGKKDTAINGENCEIIEITRINKIKLGIKCKYVVNNNEQSQTIKALNKDGEKLLCLIEKSKTLLVGRKVSDIYDLEITL